MTELLAKLSAYDSLTLDLSIAALIALIFASVVLALKRLLHRKLQARAAASHTVIDDWLVVVLAQTRTLAVLLMAGWIGLQWLTLPANIGRGIDRVAMIALIIQSGLWLHATINFWLTHRFQKEDDGSWAMTGPLLGFVLRTVTWTIILLMLLDNLGINVTTLIASLGIGGIAVALAVQNILGDLLASLSIALDKPFVIGDFIVVDALAGTVEHVGLKTTRIRSISGEQIVFSNNDLLRSRIHNYKRMQERRILFSLGIVYETPVELVHRVPAIVREVIEGQTNVRFDRAHFRSFGNSSLDFEVVYFVLDTDYGRYMDTQQSINFAILQRFTQEGIDFAYPTQTIHLAPQAQAS